MVIIQPIAHDELVADVHAFVVDGVVVLEIVGFEEKRGDAHVGGFQVAEFLDGVTHGVACVDDVFHDDDVAAVQGMVEADELAHDAGAFGARIRGEFHETDLTGNGNPLEQLGGEHESAVKHHEEQGTHALHVAVDLVGHGLDVGFDFLLGNEQSKIFVYDVYCFHCQMIAYEYNHLLADNNFGIIGFYSIGHNTDIIETVWLIYSADNSFFPFIAFFSISFPVIL